jgi:hypothetical protein
MVVVNNDNKKDDERLFFIGVTFGKYLEHYGSRNPDILLEKLLPEYVLPSLDGELTDWFKQPPLTDEEITHCLHYMHMMEDRLFSIEKEERKKLK